MSDAASTNSRSRRQWLRFSLRSLLLVTLLIGSAVMLWRNWKPWQLGPGLPAAVTSISSFSGDGRYYSSHNDNVAMVMETSTGKQIARIDTSATPAGIKLTDDASHLLIYVTNDEEHSKWIELWNIQKQERVQVFENWHFNPFPELTSDHKHLFTRNPAKIWNVATGALELSFPPIAPWDSSLPFQTQFVTPHEDWKPEEERLGRVLAAATLDQFIELSSKDSTGVHPFPGLNITASLSADCTFLATCVSGTFKAQIWNMQTRLKRCDIALPSGSQESVWDISGAVFSDDGKRVVLESLSSAGIYNADTGQFITKVPMSFDTHRFTRDGTRLISLTTVSLDTPFRTPEFYINDSQTGAELLHAEKRLVPLNDGVRGLIKESNASGITLMDLQQNLVLGTFPMENWGIAGPSSADGNTLVITEFNYPPKLWQRRRPEPWWGVAYLPEFWMTLVLSLAVLWSLRRDWREAAATSA